MALPASGSSLESEEHRPECSQHGGCFGGEQFLFGCARIIFSVLFFWGVFCNNSVDLLILFLFLSNAVGVFYRISSSMAPSSVSRAKSRGFSRFFFLVAGEKVVCPPVGGLFFGGFWFFFSRRAFHFPLSHCPCHHPIPKAPGSFSPVSLPRAVHLGGRPSNWTSSSAPSSWSVLFFSPFSLLSDRGWTSSSWSCVVRL